MKNFVMQIFPSYVLVAWIVHIDLAPAHSWPSAATVPACQQTIAPARQLTTAPD